MRRLLPLVALVAVAGAAVGIWLAGRDDAPTSSAGIDWSEPAELPPPEREDFRSEFVSDGEGYRFWPRSGRVTPSVAYRFDTGHCGLGFLTDFDGSFWRPIDPEVQRSLEYLDPDVGAIALVDFNRAIYRSSSGVDVELERVPGPVVTQPCE